jgi:DNA damage-binding protein 1
LLSSVKIADEINFKELDSYELNDGELIECIISTGAFKADDEDASPFNEMFIIGTSLLELSGTGDDTTKGRIIVFQVNKDKKLKRVTELGVKGACRSLAMCEGKLVAGLVKTVSPNCTSEIKIVFRDTDLSCILGCFICPHSIHHTRSAYH